MKNETKGNKEELALDALMGALLRQLEASEPSDREINSFLAADMPASSEARAAIKRLGPDVVRRLILARKTSDALGRKRPDAAPVFAAMHRKNVSGRHSAQTEEELKRKRKEILERLKRSRDKDKR